MRARSALSRFANLLLLISLLLLSLGLTFYQVNRLHQELLHTQTQSSPWSSRQMQWLSHIRAGISARYDLVSGLLHSGDAEDVKRDQVHGLLKEAIPNRREELKSTVSSTERELEKGSFKEESLTEFPSKLVQPAHEQRRLTSSSWKFFPLKNKTIAHEDSQFMSLLKGRGMELGAPEFFVFPQGPHEPRLLCLRGNHSSDGTQNSYALALKEEVPTSVHLLRGITLLSNTHFDFYNPWHSMFNLFQFVYWHIDNRCSHAKNLFLFHKGQYRTSTGNWIKFILKANGLPSIPSSIDLLARTNSHVFNGTRSATICLEQAVVSRNGISTTKQPLRTRTIREVNCQVRRACNISFHEGEFTNLKRLVNVTLLVRKGARGFLDDLAWQHVVKEQCEAVLDCNWSVMYVANLSFCEQVEAMSRTNIVVSAHGAQMANIIFMAPGGSIMELLPSGWLELAGDGQYIYRHAAKWVGLKHEGYWRDPSTPPCPNPSDKRGCFDHYKKQPLGINVTYIQNWLGDVIARHQRQASLDSTHLQHTNPNVCECRER